MTDLNTGRIGAGKVQDSADVGCGRHVIIDPVSVAVPVPVAAVVDRIRGKDFSVASGKGCPHLIPIPVSRTSYINGFFNDKATEGDPHGRTEAVPPMAPKTLTVLAIGAPAAAIPVRVWRWKNQATSIISR
jgi:hypothetical protein